MSLFEPTLDLHIHCPLPPQTSLADSDLGIAHRTPNSTMATDADTSAGTNASSGPTPLLSLSKGQLQRLRDHLDERLLSLERDERKE